MIEDVIKHIRPEFINAGVDEQVLLDLQESWERKLHEAKRLQLAAKEAASLKSTDGSASAASSASGSAYALHHHANAPSAAKLAAAAGDANAGGQLHAPAASRSSAGAATTPSGMVQFSAYSEYDLDDLDRELTGPTALDVTAAYGGSSSGAPPASKRYAPNNQLDGIDDGHDDDASNSHAASASESDEDADVGDDDDDQEDADDDSDELGSELDDESESEAAQAYAAANSLSRNFITCQYEKVTRSKNKWKCILKDGMMHINGRDYAFHRATCDFEW